MQCFDMPACLRCRWAVHQLGAAQTASPTPLPGSSCECLSLQMHAEECAPSAGGLAAAAGAAPEAAAAPVGAAGVGSEMSRSNRSPARRALFSHANEKLLHVMMVPHLQLPACQGAGLTQQVGQDMLIMIVHLDR